MRELLRSKPPRHPEVVPLIMVGLAVDRLLESNFFPGLLDGLVGSLGIAASGTGTPPTSSNEGAGHAWSTAARGAVSCIEQRDAEAPEAAELPPSLDFRFEETFLETQRHLIPPVFSDPLSIPRMAKAVFELAKPPAGSTHRHVALPAPPQPESSGPKQGVLESGNPSPAPHSLLQTLGGSPPESPFRTIPEGSPRGQEVCAWILELREGEVATRQLLDSSPTFCLRWPANETRPPVIIGAHWIDYLDMGGGPPHQLQTFRI